MMQFNVVILEEAEKDLDAAYSYLKNQAGKSIAQKEIDLLETACESLSENPERGSIPYELEVIGTFEYRQIIHKKFRIIYQISESFVLIFGIPHGRRNVSEISSQRLRY
jgi:toxin ParE1/3/4